MRGSSHNAGALSPEQQSRVKLVEGNLLDIGHDPIGCLGGNAIHFEFPDGSAIRHDWHLGSVPELRDLLLAAGFARSEVYGEGTNLDTGAGNRRLRAPRPRRGRPGLGGLPRGLRLAVPDHFH
jgi:hypothetical protein